MALSPSGIVFPLLPLLQVAALIECFAVQRNPPSQKLLVLSMLQTILSSTCYHVPRIDNFLYKSQTSTEEVRTIS